MRRRPGIYLRRPQPSGIGVAGSGKVEKRRRSRGDKWSTKEVFRKHVSVPSTRVRGIDVRPAPWVLKSVSRIPRIVRGQSADGQKHVGATKSVGNGFQQLSFSGKS